MWLFIHAGINIITCRKKETQKLIFVVAAWLGTNRKDLPDGDYRFNPLCPSDTI